MATTKRSLRQAWFQVHKWIGIILAIILIPLSLTGSFLVWDEPLDPWLNPKRHAVTGPVALPASAYLAAAAKSFPTDARVTSLAMPQAGDAVVVSASPPPAPGPRRGPPARISVWLDPATAKVIDVGSPMTGLVRFMHVFHGSLQIPIWGRSIVGWLGVAMAISCLTGIWLWWPMAGTWVRGLRWRRQPKFDANLHHMVGFWISIPLAVLSITGVFISFPVLTGNRPPAAQQAGSPRSGGETGARQRATGGGAAGPGGPARPLANPALTVDQAIAAAGPARAQLTVTWPTETERSWRVTTGDEGARRVVNVDDESGAVTPGRGGGGQRSLMRKLHDGTGMGLAWQIIIFLGGIAPAALGITGIVMWLRTRGWRSEVAQRARARRVV